MPLPETVRIAHILECAAQAYWSELMPAADAGAIQMEYGAESDNSLQYLKVWSSTTRGHWDLVCEQWFTAAWSHVPGLHFFGGHHSENLGHVLEVVARNQKAFEKLSVSGSDGFIQVSPPTEDERRAAEQCIAEVMAGLGSSPAEQATAA